MKKGLIAVLIAANLLMLVIGILTISPKRHYTIYATNQ
jgi:hypothetical protein